MATPIFTCGFECGVLGSNGEHWVASGATISTTTIRSDLRSIRCNPTATIHYVQSAILASSTRWVGRFYIRFTTLPTSDTILAGVEFTGPLVRFKQSDSKIYAAVSTTLGSTGVTVTTGVWYLIDFDFNIQTGGNDFCDVRVDGVACGQATATGLSAAQQTFVCGVMESSTADLFIDDVILSHTAGDYPLGPGKVISYVPNADGTHNVAGTNDFELTLTGTDILNSTTDAYLLVNDRPLESGSGVDWINMKAPPNATDYVEVAFEDSVESIPPRAVEVIAGIHQAAATPGNMEIRLNDNGTMGTVYTATDVVGVTSITYKRANFTNPPSAASTWVLGGGGNGDFNNIKVRFGSPALLDVIPDQYFDCIMIEAEYPGPRIKSEPVGIYETTRRLLGLRRLRSEVAGVVESIVKIVTEVALGPKNKSENVRIFETTRSLLGLRRFRSEVIGVIEVTRALLTLRRFKSEVAGVVETTRKILGLRRLTLEISGVVEAVKKSLGLVRIKSEVFGIVEDVVKYSSSNVPPDGTLTRRIVAVIGIR